MALGHRSSFSFFRGFPAEIENHWFNASLGSPTVEPQLRLLMRALGNLVGFEGGNQGADKLWEGRECGLSDRTGDQHFQPGWLQEGLGKSWRTPRWRLPSQGLRSGRRRPALPAPGRSPVGARNCCRVYGRFCFVVICTCVWSLLPARESQESSSRVIGHNSVWVWALVSFSPLSLWCQRLLLSPGLLQQPPDWCPSLRLCPTIYSQGSSL